MARLTPDEIGQKYAQRTAAATPDWVRGINGVTRSPGEAAAAQADKWAQNTAAAKDRFKMNSARVDISTWKSRAIAKQSRYAQGTQEGASSMVEFQRAFQPFQDGITARVRAMPSTTFEQRIQRMVAQATDTSKFKRS